MSQLSVVVKPSIMAEILYLTERCHYEVGGVLSYRLVDKNVIYVDDVIHLVGDDHQSAYFEIKPELLGEEIIKRAEQGKPFAVLGWWHSHVNMEPYPSSTDMEMINDFIKRYKGPILSLIVNKKRKFELLYTSELFDVGIENLSIKQLEETGQEINKVEVAANSGKEV